MSDPLHVNLKVRVALLVQSFGILDLERVNVFVRAIEDVVDQHYPQGRPTLLTLEPLISEQLVFLESALGAARAGAGLSSGGVFPPVTEPENPGLEQVDQDEAQEADAEEQASEEPTRPRRRLQQLRGNGGVEAKSMEEKLRDEREPIQQLISEDCVAAGLLNKKQAKKMLGSLLGKRPQEAEAEIVEQLRRILQEQVKATVRRSKGCPWSKPAAQEEMRKDIQSARSVKSILMLARQISKEQQQWKKANGKGGLLGMFG